MAKLPLLLSLLAYIPVGNGIIGNISFAIMPIISAMWIMYT